MSQNETPTVLIVDDDEVDTMMIERAVHDYEFPIRILSVRNGLEALELLKNDRPHLILMDVRMPIMNGHETLRRIKGDTTLRSIPVVIMSTSTDRDDIDLCYANHANAYMVKTLSNENRAKSIDNLLHFWLQSVTQ